jgi:ribosome-binding factor A
MIKKPKNPNRIARVNSYIQQNLSEILQKFLSEQKGLVTISKVETSQDMKWAKIWLSILGGDDDKILGYINKNIYHIQGELNKTFKTKIIPRLQFFLDTSPRYVQHIEEVIKKIHKDDQTSKP